MARSAIVGPNLVYKYGVDRIYSFREIVILRAPHMRRINDKVYFRDATIHTFIGGSICPFNIILPKA